MGWRLAAFLTVGLSLSGCGSSSSSSNGSSSTRATKSVPAGTWTGFGAKLSDFQAAHPKATSGCTSGCYGQTVGSEGQVVYQFRMVMTTGAPDYRVDAFTYALPDKTGIAAAKDAILRLMLADTKQTFFTAARASNGSCANWGLRSPTLGKWFAAKKVGDPSGDVGVTLNTVTADGTAKYDPSSVTAAIIGIGLPTPGC
jgi:hypothetical protein